MQWLNAATNSTALTAVCLQNTFCPGMTKLFKIWKIFLGQIVLHSKQIIWYLNIFFIRQLFVYFFAPDVPNGHHKDFLDLVFLPFYEL